MPVCVVLVVCVFRCVAKRCGGGGRGREHRSAKRQQRGSGWWKWQHHKRCTPTPSVLRLIFPFWVFGKTRKFFEFHAKHACSSVLLLLFLSWLQTSVVAMVAWAPACADRSISQSSHIPTYLRHTTTFPAIPMHTVDVSWGIVARNQLQA